LVNSNSNSVAIWPRSSQQVSSALRISKRALGPLIQNPTEAAFANIFIEF